jgi:hypothetical protein
MERECSTHGRDEKCILVVRKPEEERSLSRPRRRWEDILWILGK